MAQIAEVLLVLFFLFGISSQACDECTCCNEDACDVDNKCTNGCKPGYWGETCTESCPENCITCESNIKCTECRPGYHGNQCRFECGKGCINNTCLQYGECTCKSSDFKGRYCSSCSSSDKYGDACNYTCPPNCGACQSKIVCSWCKNFFHYGSYCQLICSVGCKNMTCNMDGNCKTGCKAGYTGGKCDSCASGKYGHNCDLDCPSNCTSCSSNSNCTECKQGFYGQTCANICSPGCVGICSTNNGQCIVCKQGSYGDFCNYSKTCDVGFYGYNCSKPCGTEDNNCQKCLTNEKGKYGGCVECISGYYPEIPFGIDPSLCTSCSKECKDNTCTAFGFCTNGCSHGKWGRTCRSDCTFNCLECDQSDGKCIKCENGRYSEDCSKLCSTNCRSFDGQQLCEFYNGECINGCSSYSKYGQYCEHKCSITCINQTCNWKTGHCSHGCVKNYHGSFCENECSCTCKAEDEKRSCNDSNGFCISGCEDGFYGNICESKCEGTCVNETCNRVTAECVYGCIQGYEGLQCRQALTHTRHDDGVTTGEVVGIVFGSVLIGVLIGVALTLTIIIWKRRKARKREEIDEHADVNYESQNNIPVTYEDLKARDETTYSQINTVN